MKLLIIVSLFILSSCCEKYNPETKEYVLSTGKVVRCKKARESDCGVEIYECDDKIKYHCQNNVNEKE